MFYYYVLCVARLYLSHLNLSLMPLQVGARSSQAQEHVAGSRHVFDDWQDTLLQRVCFRMRFRIATVLGRGRADEGKATIPHTAKKTQGVFSRLSRNEIDTEIALALDSSGLLARRLHRLAVSGSALCLYSPSEGGAGPLHGHGHKSLRRELTAFANDSVLPEASAAGMLPPREFVQELIDEYKYWEGPTNPQSSGFLSREDRLVFVTRCVEPLIQYLWSRSSSCAPSSRLLFSLLRYQQILILILIPILILVLD